MSTYHNRLVECAAYLARKEKTTCRLCRINPINTAYPVCAECLEKQAQKFEQMSRNEQMRGAYCASFVV